MTSVRRLSMIACRIGAASAVSASSQVVRSNFPLPRAPTRLSGYKIRSGSSIWFSVAGPFAQFRPREPGWYGLPSSLRIFFVSLSMYATSPHAASQLKHVVGTSMYRFSTFLGHAVDSYSTQSSHSATGGKFSSGVTFMEGGSLIGTLQDNAHAK